MGTQERVAGDHRRALLLVAVAAVSSLAWISPAHAIPVFARKYQTACITCHTMYPKLNDVGEAFRRNGYQFPNNEEVLVKDEPVKLGVDAYKAMFPDSIWPSTLPGLPPISIFAQEQNIVNLKPQGLEKTVDFYFPSDIEFIGAGTFGQNISALWNIGFSPGSVDTVDGFSTAPAAVGVGRVFVQFDNLFAWSAEEDEDGTHEGSRWLVLPPHALNLKIGKIDPGVIPHVISEECFPLLQYPVMPSNTYILGQTGFSLFSEQPGIEINGIIKQYWSYYLGIANGGSAAYLAQDDNTFKDVYFRVSRKWYGFPLDGVVGSSDGGEKGAAQPQAPDDAVYNKPGLDFWRAVSFETGVFGWAGKANIPNLPSGLSYNPNDPATFNKDYFTRIGLNARVKYFDIDVYGMIFWGHDPFPGYLQDGVTPAGPTDQMGIMVESDYMFKPWIMGFLRYEQVKVFNPAFTNESLILAPGAPPQGPEQARVVPGAIFAIRQNLQLATEVYIDLQGYPAAVAGIPESTYQWITTVKFAF